MKLLKAHHFMQDFVRDGVPVWWDDSDEVFFEVKKKISRSRAAIEKAESEETKGDKKAPHGRYYVPVPKTRGGAPFPTFQDWVKETRRKNGEKGAVD